MATSLFCPFSTLPIGGIYFCSCSVASWSICYVTVILWSEGPSFPPHPFLNLSSRSVHDSQSSLPMQIVSDEYEYWPVSRCSCFPPPSLLIFFFPLAPLSVLSFTFRFRSSCSLSVFLSCSSCLRRSFLSCSSCVLSRPLPLFLVLSVVSPSVLLGTSPPLVDLSAMHPVVALLRFSRAPPCVICTALSGIMFCPIFLVISCALILSFCDSFRLASPSCSYSCIYVPRLLPAFVFCLRHSGILAAWSRICSILPWKRPNAPCPVSLSSTSMGFSVLVQGCSFPYSS